MDYKGNIKVANFSISKTYFVTNHYIKNRKNFRRLNFRWMALECFDTEWNYSTPSDVVSLNIIKNT